MAAAVGNQYAKKAKAFEGAIKRALARFSGSSVEAGLDTIADQLVRTAALGEQWAIRELADRIEGRPAQSVTVAGDDEGGPIHMVHEVALVAIDATEGRATPQDT